MPAKDKLIDEMLAKIRKELAEIDDALLADPVRRSFIVGAAIGGIRHSLGPVKEGKTSEEQLEELFEMLKEAKARLRPS